MGRRMEGRRVFYYDTVSDKEGKCIDIKRRAENSQKKLTAEKESKQEIKFPENFIVTFCDGTNVNETSFCQVAYNGRKATPYKVANIASPDHRSGRSLKEDITV
jgi:hypothetical protein